MAGLWAEWQRIGPEVAAWQGAEPGRLTSVPHSIALSLRSSRVSPAGHRLFALLGQSPAGLATEDRAALLGDAAFAAEEGLLAVGLAYHRDGRLDLLPPVRDHARLRCPPEAADATAWCRHFLELTRLVGGRIGRDGGATALTRLAPEVANLDAALRAAASLNLRDEGVDALNGMARVLGASGAGSVASIRALAKECHAVNEERGEAECHYRAGTVLTGRSNYAAARAAHDQARQLFHELGAVRDEAYCIESLGHIALARSDHAAARALYEQARPLYQQVGAVLGEANCISAMGDIARAGGDTAAAKAPYVQALALYEQLHATQNVALGHENLARVTAGAERAGHVAAARAAWASMDLPEQVARVDREFG